ncbi:MAG: NB-ARC domain-containing protein, partial [Acidobacteria bacterium]|nr:NB-ARC domain-containing protein [Acidobacteriota bacterium]
MIYTYYSYKGGVGRSMALANAAQCFYQQGLSVVMIDWDLEAPGLESFFYQDAKNPEQAEKNLEWVRSRLGLIDLLAAYKRAFPYLPAPPRPPESGSASDILPDLAAANEAASSSLLDEKFMTVLSETHPLSQYLTLINLPADKRDNLPKKIESGGKLQLLSAGWRAGARFADYVQEVQNFDWDEFYGSFRGESFFEWFRRELKKTADVILIDSRTGVTEMGGVCTRQLADVVVSFCVPNFTNLEGVAAVAASFNREDLRQRRGRDVEVIVVPARLDDRAEKDRKNHFEETFLDQFRDVRSSVFSNPNTTFWNLRIPYIPAYSYLETLVVGVKDRDKDLEEAYKRLTAHLALLAVEGSAIRKCYAEEIRRFFPDLRTRVFISCLHTDDGEGVADLRRRLEEKGISLWPDDPAIDAENESWAQERINQSEHIVLWLTTGMLDSDIARRQWRYAQQLGKSAHLVMADDPQKIQESYRWTRGTRVWTTSEWVNVSRHNFEELISLLRGPGQAPRIPFMAPQLGTSMVKRQTEVNKIKKYLLETSQTNINIGVWGAAGTGKTVIAKTACHDEDIQDHFSDGIIWVSLGKMPNIIEQLNSIYLALTGENLSFDKDKDKSEGKEKEEKKEEEKRSEAIQKLGEKLSGKRSLMVIDDVWDPEHLAPFL